MKTDLIKLADLNASVQLKPQQERIRKKLQTEPGMLAYHGLGSGKTLASIAAAEDVGGAVNVVVPAALRENFRKELAQYVKKPKAKYNIVSYEDAVKHGLPPSNLTIMDEAHRLGRLDSKRSQLAGSAPGRTLLLTGTPIRNEPSEALPLLRAVSKDRNVPRSAKEFNNRFLDRKVVNPGFFARMRGVKPGEKVTLKNKWQLAKMIHGRVDFEPSKGEFPGVSHRFIEVPMTEPQTKLYHGILNTNPSLAYKVRKNLPPGRSEGAQLNAFLSGIRQVSNDPATYSKDETGRPIERSPKIRAMFHSIVGEIKNRPKGKILVYSNYLKAGVLPVAEELKNAGIPFEIFQGGMSDSKRKKIVNAYNTDKIKVLLVSGAGSEGLDLKGTSKVQIMEPHWNAARIRQVVGRAVRNKSHAHLPPAERKVAVEYYNTKPTAQSRWFGMLPPKYELGADRYMYNLATNKQQLVDEVLDVFKQEGSI